MVEYIMKKKLRGISCKMRDAGCDASFRDCPAKGGTGGHLNWRSSTDVSITLFTLTNLHPYMWQVSDLASQPSYTDGKVARLDGDCD
jgi:hypothetical protein